jgi:hypothetical protein
MGASHFFSFPTGTTFASPAIRQQILGAIKATHRKRFM